MAEPSRRFTLRDLPFVARLTLAVFLCSVGLGYLAALVQLSVQQAKPGTPTYPMPGPDEVVAAHHGKPGVSTLERLIETPETAPFTVSGSMRKAFTSKSGGWENAIKTKAGDPEDDDPERAKKLAEAETALRKERNAEADVLVHWIKESKLDKKAYEENKYPLPDTMKDAPITPKFVEMDEKGNKQVKIASLIRSRCAKCHSEGREADFAPLDDYAEIRTYSNPAQGGMPLRKLAQTTHVHLLGFSMLYMLTGFIFACSSWPAIIRFCIAPLALVAQMVDITFWWLAHMPDSYYGTEFARCIFYSGGVAGTALALQIVMSLFSLFGWFGRFVLLLLFAAALAGGYLIVPFLVTQFKFPES